ncbi:hypothetical protein ACI79G_24035 [Geodermatophilus sp. SYSU D00779]
MPELSLDEAVDRARTGDVGVLRGGSVADRAIRTPTDARSTTSRRPSIPVAIPGP